MKNDKFNSEMEMSMNEFDEIIKDKDIAIISDKTYNKIYEKTHTSKHGLEKPKDPDWWNGT